MQQRGLDFSATNNLFNLEDLQNLLKTIQTGGVAPTITHALHWVTSPVQTSVGENIRIQSKRYSPITSCIDLGIGYPDRFATTCEC